MSSRAADRASNRDRDRAGLAVSPASAVVGVRPVAAGVTSSSGPEPGSSFFLAKDSCAPILRMRKQGVGGGGRTSTLFHEQHVCALRRSKMCVLCPMRRGRFTSATGVVCDTWIGTRDTVNRKQAKNHLEDGGCTISSLRRTGPRGRRRSIPGLLALENTASSSVISVSFLSVLSPPLRGTSPMFF